MPSRMNTSGMRTAGSNCRYKGSCGHALHFPFINQRVQGQLSRLKGHAYSMLVFRHISLHPCEAQDRRAALYHLGGPVRSNEAAVCSRAAVCSHCGQSTWTRQGFDRVPGANGPSNAGCHDGSGTLYCVEKAQTHKIQQFLVSFYRPGKIGKIRSLLLLCELRPLVRSHLQKTVRHGHSHHLMPIACCGMLKPCLVYSHFLK